MMPENELWPMSNSWTIRLHKAFFPAAREALNSRYGTPAGVVEYSMKSQVLQYEATRAMFEAFAGNKYRSSGIIYWMYNSAWPSMYWQLYDYFFTPNGSFYGAKKACETLHIQYGYNDGSVMVVNGYYKDYPGLKATATIYNFDMRVKYSREITVNVASDEARKLSFPDWPKDMTGVWFLKLILKDSKGKEISSNFYWLSDKGDEKADFTALNTLPKVDLKTSVKSLKRGKDKTEITVQIENPSSSIAFAVNPKILRSKSRDLVTPVYWDDNYFSLLPKEKRTIKAVFSTEDLNGEGPLVQIEGWNVKPWEF
jgi:exo-1,4-beta-D-glucosaminidase